jgi:hypothetical protein
MKPLPATESDYLDAVELKGCSATMKVGDYIPDSGSSRNASFKSDTATIISASQYFLKNSPPSAGTSEESERSVNKRRRVSAPSEVVNDDDDDDGIFSAACEGESWVMQEVTAKKAGTPAAAAATANATAAVATIANNTISPAEKKSKKSKPTTKGTREKAPLALPSAQNATYLSKTALSHFEKVNGWSESHAGAFNSHDLDIFDRQNNFSGVYKHSHDGDAIDVNNMHTWRAFEQENEDDIDPMLDVEAASTIDEDNVDMGMLGDVKAKNRAHAKNTRMRKKSYMESLKHSIVRMSEEVDHTHEKRKAIVEDIVDNVIEIK